MIFRGRIENGDIVLADGMHLPEGAEIEFAVLNLHHSSDASSAVSDSTAADDPIMKYIGIATDLPSDASRNLDRYLYRKPKK